MPSFSEKPIQRQIIILILSLIGILSVLFIVHSSFAENKKRYKEQLDNQVARQDIGIAIYQQLSATEVLIYKLNLMDHPRELIIIKKRIDANLQIVKNGLDVLQKGGTFEHKIETNIPGKDALQLQANYKKPQQEGYVLEVLELGSAIFNLELQAQLLIELAGLRMEQDEQQWKNTNTHIQNLLKAIDTILLRSQENAAGILFDSQQKMKSLSLQIDQAEKNHNNFRLPLVGLALFLSTYSIFITLLRIKKAIQERKQAEESLQMLLDTTVEGIYGVDLKGVTTFVNPAASKMLGYTAEELIGRENHTLIHHTHSNGTAYPATKCRILKVLQGGTLQAVDDEMFWRKNGESFPVEYSSTAIKRNGEIVGAVVNFHDISQRKQAEKKIHTLSQAVEQSPVSVILTDINGNIEYVNSAFERSTGYSAEEVNGKNPGLLKSGNTPKSHYQELWKTINSGQLWQGELQNRRKNGEVFLEHASIAPIIDKSGNMTHFLAVKEDITLQKQQEDKIIHQANYDSLTDLPNRFLAQDRLSQLIKDAQRDKKHAALLFLDLDDFKKINDTMSHEVGDKLLVQAARRLRDSVRDGDTVSRLGGDEFIVLMGNISTVEETYPVAQKLLESFNAAFLLDNRELTVTVSIGVAIYPDDGKTPAELLRNADTALYKSKAEGRNTYNYFTNTMNQGISRRLQLEEQLYGALDRNEFQLFYQPLVDVRSNTIVAAEALLRWNNEILGNVSPDEFIPVTEQTGQIVSIGQYVLNEALAMTAKWQLINPDFKIAINVSPRQFREPELLQQITDALQQSGVSSKCLELEITEGVLMSGYNYISETLSSLSKMGIGIALDDFGTGYSSLSYLRSYPFSILKIDRSFINDITIDTADRELVNAAIAMAHSLGLNVVAEGVETEEQLAHLVLQGCDIAQGYLFSKPISSNEISRMIRSKKLPASNP